LGKLDNIDKHKLVIPTLNITGLTGMNFEDEQGNRFINNRFAIEHSTDWSLIKGIAVRTAGPTVSAEKGVIAGAANSRCRR
jgi:hypothetical protein